MDMALEKEYNKPAKIAGGTIGYTQRKEAVALWNITRHEKDRQVAILTDWCDINEENGSELNMHHEFNPSSAKINNERVSDLLQYIKSISSIFSSGNKLQHVCSPETAPEN